MCWLSTLCLITLADNVPEVQAPYLWRLAWLGFALLLLLWVLIFRRKKRGKVPLRRAPVNDPFPVSTASLAAGRYRDFYSALQEELWAALSRGQKNHYPGTGAASAYFKSLQWPQDLIAEAMAIFSACELSLYTPAHVDPRAYLERARSIAG